MEREPNLKVQQTPGAEVRTKPQKGAWRLEIPPGPQRSYRLAQLDDYASQPRRAFPHRPPLCLQLHARASAADIPGTWGFGLWNDPFNLSLGLGGGTRRFPALPQAAWFFFASPQNYLSFRDDLPANGLIAQTFRSRNLPTALLAVAAPSFPLLLWPQLAQKLRPFFRRWIREDSFAPGVDVTQWHHYTIDWQKERVTFKVDDQTIATGISPQAPLGLVIWADNQYAAFPPDGKLSYGTLENPEPAWLEIEALSLEKG